MIDAASVGVAGEHLVCADLILNGFRAFRVDGLPYDVVADCGGQMLRIQVKTTGEPRNGYLWVLRKGGSSHKGRDSRYSPNEVDLFALVAYDIKRIAYLPCRAGMTSVRIRSPGIPGGRQFDDLTIQRVLMEGSCSN